MRSAPQRAGSASGKVMLVGFGLGLVMAEVLARFAVPSLAFHFPTMRMADDRFTERAGKVMDGNGVRYAFDATGFRTAGASTPEAGRPAALFIGDSFTEGLGVEAKEAFPAVACDRLAKQGVNVSCLNAGVSGFGTAHELRMLRRLLGRDDLHVAAVVFQVLPNNDLRDNWEDGGFETDGGRLVVREPPRIPASVRWRVALLDNPFARSVHLVKLAANALVDGGDAETQYDAAAFELEQRLLEEVVATVRQHRIPVVFVVCATAWELNAIGSQPYDERARLDFVAAAIRRLNVPWIDSRSVAGTPADYLPDDGHFSVAGNARMGDALAQTLRPLL